MVVESEKDLEIMIEEDNISTEDGTERMSDPDYEDCIENNDIPTEIGDDRGSDSEGTEIRNNTIEDNLGVLSDLGNIVGVEEVAKKTRNKRRHMDKQEWDVLKQKMKRSKGEEYKGLTKKNGKWVFSKIRNARQLKPPCLCALSRRNSKLHCNLISEKERMHF